MYGQDTEFYQHLLYELGNDSALEKQLLRVRYEMIGETSKSNPKDFFEKIYGSEHKIIIGDSDELGPNWRSEIDQKNPNTQFNWENMTSDIIQMSVNDEEEEELDEIDEESNENDGDSEQNGENNLPKRVIVYTNDKLVKLLAKGLKTSM